MFWQKLWRFWGRLIGWAWLCSMIFARAGQAATYADLFFEDFNDPTLDLAAQWELVQGNWQDWTLLEGRLQATLQAPPQSSDLRSMITPKDEFWPDFENYQVSFDFYVHDSADKNFAILFQNRLGAHDLAILDFIDFHFINQRLYINDIQINRGVYANVLSFPLEIARKYQVTIRYFLDQFSLYIDEELIYQTNDQWPAFSHGGGKIAFRASSGIYPLSVSSFDNLKVTAYGDLALPLVSQLNPAWAEQIYNRADLWAGENNRIGDWGCALSSAVMLLHYYGYDQLGENELNPATLNQWLLTQRDGYIGNGLLNWLAICRLVALLSADCSDCPKLEYRYFESANPLLQVKTDLDLLQPVIAHSAGHFFVIDGQSADGDLMIKDPYFDFKQLSEQSDPILSLRLFEPSQTDLSYWLIELPAGANIDLDAQGSAAIELQALGVEWPGEEQFYYLAKPSAGQYLLNLSFLQAEDFKTAKFYFYQSDASVQVFDLASLLADALFFDAKNFSLKLDYFKNQASDLSLIAERPATLSFYLDYQLQALLGLKQAASLKNDQLGESRYQSLIEQFLAFYNLQTIQL